MEDWLDLATAALGAAIMLQVVDGDLTYLLVGPQGQVWAEGDWEDVEKELKRRAADIGIVSTELRFSTTRDRKEDLQCA